jgi:hypothetical protein
MSRLILPSMILPLSVRSLHCYSPTCTQAARLFQRLFSAFIAPLRFPLCDLLRLNNAHFQL